MGPRWREWVCKGHARSEISFALSQPHLLESFMSYTEPGKYPTGSASTNHEHLEVCAEACVAARRVMDWGGHDEVYEAAGAACLRGVSHRVEHAQFAGQNRDTHEIACAGNAIGSHVPTA